MNASKSGTEYNKPDYDKSDASLTSWGWVEPASFTKLTSSPATSSLNSLQPPAAKFDFLRPLRHWLDRVEVSDPGLAHRLCQLIPSQCPFERDVKVLGRVLFHIPPLCKLNPVYDEVVALRFRALCYLADVCGEDISQYC